MLGQVGLCIAGQHVEGDAAPHSHQHNVKKEKSRKCRGKKRYFLKYFGMQQKRYGHEAPCWRIRRNGISFIGEGSVAKLQANVPLS